MELESKRGMAWRFEGWQGNNFVAERCVEGHAVLLWTRFENGIGTNPEELIAAAHAGCFTMALSAHN